MTIKQAYKNWQEKREKELQEKSLLPRKEITSISKKDWLNKQCDNKYCPTEFFDGKLPV